MTPNTNPCHQSTTDRAPQGGRHQIGTPGGFMSESVGGIVGIRLSTDWDRVFKPRATSDSKSPLFHIFTVLAELGFREEVWRL